MPFSTYPEIGLLILKELGGEHLAKCRKFFYSIIFRSPRGAVFHASVQG
jgi:hypothetical protein